MEMWYEKYEKEVWEIIKYMNNEINTDIVQCIELQQAEGFNYSDNFDAGIHMVLKHLLKAMADLTELNHKVFEEEMELFYRRNKMKDIRVGVYETYKKRTIHAIKELNFDVEFRKDIVDEDYYCIIKSFYNGSNCEWYSPSFETFKECQKWATDKLKKGGWQVSYIK